ncbi:S8 family serine peptidase [Ectobacillus funiculus]|uniref:S8 family serine peptidase n=1 Tax=Ectobacillus funiculus TaxID=137993 RepID=UPI00101E1B87|nr:S8 family serine peptidase [Ectobacillus funiculus]
MKKITSIVLSASLAFGAIPALAEASQSADQPTGNLKKGSQKVTPIVQVPAKSAKKARNVQSFAVKKGKKFKENELIVKFKNTYDVQSLGEVQGALGLKKKKDLGDKGTKLVEFKSGVKIEDAINALKASPLVEYAEPNYILYPSDVEAEATPKDVTDPLYGELWGLRNTGQSIEWVTGTPGIDIKAEGAWLRTQGNPNVVVAVIDTGTDINHPDIKNQIWKNPGEIAGDGIDNDNNGYIDDVNGWDFFHNDNTVFDADDGDEHGTHVSGTIAGSANGIGVIGVAPNVKIMPLKFLGPDGGDSADAIQAINYAKAKGVKITNNSWGGGDFSQALYDAIKGSNSLFVAAAGNDGINIDTQVSYPAGFDLPNILSVAAIDNTGNVADFSNYGTKNVDIAAPGVSIKSSVPKGWSSDYSYAYEYLNGTSMATPHATGVAALLQSTNSTISPADLKSSIMNTVTKLSSLTGIVGTGGLLNAQAAVNTQADNDIPGKPFPGTTVSNTVSATTDLDDVYSLDLKKGEKVTVTLTGAAGTDFDLYLYKPSATTVKSSDGIAIYSEKAGTSSETFTYIAPEAGTYYVDVYAYKGAGSYTATVKQGATAGTYENNAKEIGYIGSWSTLSAADASGGSFVRTNVGGSQVQFVFNGTGISLRGAKSSTQGIAKVTIDGVSSEVNLYAPSLAYKIEYFKKTGLAAGRHVVTIEWTGKAAPGARKSATYINLDTIVVN